MLRNRRMAARPTLLMSLMNQSNFQSSRQQRDYSRLQASTGPDQSGADPGVEPTFRRDGTTLHRLRGYGAQTYEDTGMVLPGLSAYADDPIMQGGPTTVGDRARRMLGRRGQQGKLMRMGLGQGEPWG